MHNAIELAAQAGIAGIPPMALLHEGDPFKRALMQKIVERNLELRRELNGELARQIIHELAKATKK